MAKENQKGVYKGNIEKEENGNYLSGPYHQDNQQVEATFKIGDEVNLKTVIENPSDKTYEKYPKKSKLFFLANKKE